MHIQSFVDVITNSSTSIYTFYDQDGINTIKDCLNNIIHVFDPNANIDDVLDIKLTYSSDFLDWLDENKNELFSEDESNEELLLNYSDRLEELAENYCENWYDHYAWGYDIEVTAKDPKYEHLVSCILNVIEPFEHEATFS